MEETTEHISIVPYDTNSSVIIVCNSGIPQDNQIQNLSAISISYGLYAISVGTGLYITDLLSFHKSLHNKEMNLQQSSLFYTIRGITNVLFGPRHLLFSTLNNLCIISIVTILEVQQDNSKSIQDQATVYKHPNNIIHSSVSNDNRIMLLDDRNILNMFELSFSQKLTLIKTFSNVNTYCLHQNIIIYSLLNQNSIFTENAELFQQQQIIFDPISSLLEKYHLPSQYRIVLLKPFDNDRFILVIQVEDTQTQPEDGKKQVEPSVAASAELISSKEVDGSATQSPPAASASSSATNENTSHFLILFVKKKFSSCFAMKHLDILYPKNNNNNFALWVKHVGQHHLLMTNQTTKMEILDQECNIVQSFDDDSVDKSQICASLCIDELYLNSLEKSFEVGGTHVGTPLIYIYYTDGKLHLYQCNSEKNNSVKQVQINVQQNRTELMENSKKEVTPLQFTKFGFSFPPPSTTNYFPFTLNSTTQQANNVVSSTNDFQFPSSSNFDLHNFSFEPRKIVKIKESTFKINLKKYDIADSTPKVLFSFDKNIEQLQKLYDNFNYSDWKVVFKRSGRTIYIFSGLLAMWSPVFEAMFQIDMQEKDKKVLSIAEEENDNEDLFELLLKTIHFPTVSVPFCMIVDYEAILEKYELTYHSKQVQQEILKQITQVSSAEKGILFTQLNDASESLIQFLCDNIKDEIPINAFENLDIDHFLTFLDKLPYKENRKVDMAMHWLQYSQERSNFAFRVISAIPKLDNVDLKVLFQIAQSFSLDENVRGYLLQVIFHKNQLGDLPTSTLQYKTLNRFESNNKLKSATLIGNYNYNGTYSSNNSVEIQVIGAKRVYLSKVGVIGSSKSTYSYSMSISNVETKQKLVQQSDTIVMPESCRFLICTGIYLDANIKYLINVQMHGSALSIYQPTLKNEMTLCEGVTIKFVNQNNFDFHRFEFGYDVSEASFKFNLK